MSDRKEFRDLADPGAAHEAIASLDLEPEPETVPLEDARGRVLAERVDAELDVPGFDRASMDGYAVRARDTFGADEADPVTLDLVGEVHAGAEPDVTVDPGTCAEISTGAVLPDGADAVVMVERTSEVGHGDEAAGGTAADGPDSEDRIAVRTAVAPGDNVMFAGADIAAGGRALGPGTEITPREIGLLSALGVDEVPVRGKPTVGIVSTGDELVRPGEDLHSERGQIYDVNSYTIAAGVEEAGGEAELYPHAGDDLDEMERLLVRASEECDLVLSSGSTSASAVDVIYRVIEERGELLLHGVSVKPGKPMLVGRLGGSQEGSDAAGDDRREASTSATDSSDSHSATDSTDSHSATDSTDSIDSAYVGLPGYPVSALTIFRTFVAPAIRRAAGIPEPRTATVAGTMAVQERYTEGRMRLMPAGLVEDGDGNTLVYPVDKGSGATTSLVEADGVVVVDPDTEYLAAGEPVEVQLFSPDVRAPTLFAVGEDDPALSRLLDRVERPRYLALGSREGLRRLRDGVPDAAVTAGPTSREAVAAPDPTADGDREPLAAEVVGEWTRDWGLIVPAGNPDDVTGLADLVDRDLRFVNRDSNAGLRTSLANALADLADERGATRRAMTEAIDGFDRAVRAHESPARRVIAGDADAGLGLRATAERLDTGFVPVGTQTVTIHANPARIEKPGVARLRAAVADGDDVFDALAGYEK